MVMPIDLDQGENWWFVRTWVDANKYVVLTPINKSDERYDDGRCLDEQNSGNAEIKSRTATKGFHKIKTMSLDNVV